ncbi:MAG: heavy metal translocating P-type ATPase [Ruminococcaceae bacterium]|nr:heavy metal translocating P-type ATPase [Oscillospiraceae bacterium]
MKKTMRENKAMIIRLLISVCLIIAGLILNGFNGYFAMILYLCAYFLCAYKIIGGAIKKLLKQGEIGEKMLMTVATLGAIATEAYFEASFVIVLYLLGELIEESAEEKTKSSIKALTEIRPITARIKGTKTMVDINKVKIGDVIEVYAGERIPLDGVVLEGYADIDTAVVTGESEAVPVRANSLVYAGYMNLNGALTIEVQRENNQSMVQRIIDISLNAESKKSKREAFIKKFAKIYTPIVMALAVLIAVIPTLFGLDMGTWLYKAFSLLAVSCPCAIVISVPLAYFCAIGYASRKGILIKGARTLEKLTELNTMAFDKTGTLTKAEVRITKVESFNGITKMELLEILGIVEKKSTHPVAQAVQKEVERFKLNIEDGENYHEELGRGAECDSSKGHIKAGTFAFAGGDEQFSGATIYISLNGRFIGYFGVGDSIKENGKISFDKLRTCGIEKIYIISGDKQSKVDAVASTLYADGAYSQLLPEHKLDALEDIIKTHENVKIGYCGDGVNDTPCLSRADVGFAMGALGSDVAIEKGDVIIADDDLEKIPKAIKIAKSTKRTIITNIALAIGIKALVAVLTLSLPSFPMALAVFADVGVMLITVLNALRAGRKMKNK